MAVKKGHVKNPKKGKKYGVSPFKPPTPEETQTDIDWIDTFLKDSNDTVGGTVTINPPEPLKKNPILLIKPSAWQQKSVPGSSHDKLGKYGGVSSYTDADVAEARSYMQQVLNIESMEINGRDLAHVLAEVAGYAGKDSQDKKRRIAILEAEVKGLNQERTNLEYELEIAMEELRNSEQLIKKVSKEKIGALDTGRRIKD